MIPNQYVYLTGCLILFAIWLLIFWRRKDLRREMLWASCLGLPFGIVDYFLVPEYWHPDSLFGLMKVYGAGLESFFFLFVMAGIASVAYQSLHKRRSLRRISGEKKRGRHLGLLLLVALVYVLASVLSPAKSVYYLMMGGGLGALATSYYRPDLRKQMFASAFLFSLVYFAVFVFLNLIFKGWVQEFYNLNNTWGILILGVPLEEIGVAFFAGSFWSTLYEYTKSYRDG